MANPSVKAHREMSWRASVSNDEVTRAASVFFRNWFSM